MRLYLDLGLEDGLVDNTTGRVAAPNVDPKRLLEVRACIGPHQWLITEGIFPDREKGSSTLHFRV